MGLFDSSGYFKFSLELLTLTIVFSFLGTSLANSPDLASSISLLSRMSVCDLLTELLRDVVSIAESWRELAHSRTSSLISFRMVVSSLLSLFDPSYFYGNDLRVGTSA